MKIEKINDNQIRCTLNKHDLASREIKLSELAYGTEKAKNLFRDMMQQASYEYGFEADDHPLMIEAIPLSADSIILNISKVEDPDELDMRFSKFAPSLDEADEPEELEDEFDDFADDTADEILDYFSCKEPSELEKNIKDSFISLRELLSDKFPGKDIPKPTMQETSEEDDDFFRIYKFQNFSTVERLSSVLKNVYSGINTLYKDCNNSIYYLVINKSDHTPEEFNRICNILTEYGIRENASDSREAYFREHFTPMIKEDALQVLATL